MLQDVGHGGYRAGARRKPKYEDKTVVMRVPRNQVESIQRLLTREDSKGLGEVREIARQWRERIGDGKRCTQPRWKHAYELLEEIERAVEGNLKK